jgi:hypothetical protein
MTDSTRRESCHSLKVTSKRIGVKSLLRCGPHPPNYCCNYGYLSASGGPSPGTRHPSEQPVAEKPCLISSRNSHPKTAQRRSLLAYLPRKTNPELQPSQLTRQGPSSRQADNGISRPTIIVALLSSLPTGCSARPATLSSQTLPSSDIRYNLHHRPPTPIVSRTQTAPGFFSQSFKRNSSHRHHRCFYGDPCVPSFATSFFCP